ncbi:hypothetical protein, partial [Sinorhizobium meliloti]|uniref:hypothetical protein n=1 Tax=Rhizobium meliloti TaxID=382 RepID=UPI0012FD689D
ANTYIALAIDPQWVVDASGKEIQVKPDIPDSAYCLLAIARRAIKPGEELLLDYDNDLDTDAGNYFWGAEHYYSPHVSTPASKASFSGGTCLLLPVGTDQPNANASLATVAITLMLRQGGTLTETAARLNDR